MVEQILDHQNNSVVGLVVGIPVMGKAHVRKQCHDRDDALPHLLTYVKDPVVALDIEHILGE